MTTEVAANHTPKAPPKILPFDVQDGYEISLAAPEHIPSLVEGLLLEVGTSMISGKPKYGKSSLARTLAVAVAEGKSFLGLPVLQGDSLYLNLEGPRGVLGQHFRKLGLSGKNGKIRVIDERMPRTGEYGLQRLILTIEKYSPLRLVVVDSAAKLLRLMDSFDPGEVGRAIEELETIAKDHKLHLLFTSWSKKRETSDPGDAPMGSTAFRGGTDSNVFLTKDGKNRIIGTEQRWGVEMEPTILLQDENLVSYLGSTVESIQESQSESRTETRRHKIRRGILDFVLLETTPTKSEIVKGVRGKDEDILEVLDEMLANDDLKETVMGRMHRVSVPELPVETTEENAAVLV